MVTRRSQSVLVYGSRSLVYILWGCTLTFVSWVGQHSLHRGVCCLATSPTGKNNATLRVCIMVQLRDEPTVQVLFCLRNIKNFLKLSLPPEGSGQNKFFIGKACIAPRGSDLIKFFIDKCHLIIMCGYH